MADEYKRADAEDAGWRVVHEADPDAGTANADGFRAEKYHSPPGYSGTFIEEWGETEEKLMERIAARERNLSGYDTSTVFLPNEDAEEVSTSNPDSFERVTDDVLTAARQNDVLTVLSDPEDPESEPVQKVIVGGEESDAGVLSEPAAPNSATERDVLDANQAAIDSATGSRDDADTPEEADGTQASQDAAQARHESLQDAHDNARASDEGMQGGNLQGDPGDSGNDPETVQPEAGEATDASDSEQQGQVNDSEAASSDAVSTNADDGFLEAGRSQPEVEGPDSDSEAPDPAPNARAGHHGHRPSGRILRQRRRGGEPSLRRVADRRERVRGDGAWRARTRLSVRVSTSSKRSASPSSRRRRRTTRRL
jgi:hypothetical protein